MDEPRRGTVVLIRRGDPEIVEAIASGLLAGATTLPPVPREAQPTARSGEADRAEIVTATADRDRVVAALVRVAVGNNKTAEDYRGMIVTARRVYATRRRSGPMRRAAVRLLVAWATLWQGVRYAYRAQDAVLGRSERGRRHA